MADSIVYKIISSTGVELNGTITIEDLGFEKQAITNFQDTTPDGIPVNYNFEGEPSFSSNPETLAEVAIVNLNNTLEGTYGIQGNLTFKSIKEEPTPVDESENTPTYQVAADNSEVKGTITFFARDNGYYGQIILTNFPEGYVITSTLVTPPIVEANYETLKVEALNLGQEYLDTLKTNDVDFGTLEIVSSDEEQPTKFIEYKTKGTVVDNENNPLPGATIKDTRGNSTTSQTTGDFTLDGDYTSGSLFDINVSATGYGQVTKTPFTQEGIIKNNIGVIKLQTTQTDLQEAKNKELPLDEAKTKAIKASKTDFEMAKQQAMNQVITNIKQFYYPLF